MVANPLIRKKPKMTGRFTGGHKSAGILDDFAERKSVNTQEAEIQTINKSGDTLQIGDGTDASTATAGILFISEITDTGLIIRNNTSDTEIAMDTGSIVANARVGTSTADNFDIITNNLKRITIFSSGFAAGQYDQSTADTSYIPNVLFGTDATPPTASTTTRGSIYIQYTA